MIAKLKTVVSGTLRRSGLQVIRLPAGKSAYERSNSSATYAPWNLSREFLSVYNAIHRYSLVDIYRCWELWTLVEQTAKSTGGVLEVGVWRGGTGVLMSERNQMVCSDEPVYLCDTFEGVVKAGLQDARYRGGEHADTSQRIVEDLVKARNVANVQVLKGIFPDDTAQFIPSDAKFRLCHIDVDVYQSAKDVMAWVWSRLIPGGVIVFDDYGFRGCEGITRYVNEQTGEPDRIVLHNLNGHAIVIKTLLSHPSCAGNTDRQS